MFKGRLQTSQPESPASFADASEEVLLTAAMQYDEAALSELYDRYEAKIYNYIFRRTGDEALAEDFTSQVFLKMLESIRDQKAWHSSFSGWLYRIAHNLVIDHYRRKGKQDAVELEEASPLTSGEEPLEVKVAHTLDAERLRSAIRRLTEEQAEVVSLRFLEGYSISEVAVMMNRTEGAIKALQYRAVATLRSMLYGVL